VSGTADVVIASNRGPIGFRRDSDGAIVGSRGGGGLVSGIAGLAGGGTSLWVCSALSATDREVAAAAPDGRLDLAGYATGGPVRMLAIDAGTFAGAYTTVSNSTLWYLHHGLIDPDRESIADDLDAWRRDWLSYIDYNTAFAEAIAADAADEARVLVQDYHLTVLPTLLRSRRPDLRIGLFTHTPWATPRSFALLPEDVAADLLTGMLGADSLGFHSARWADDFVACCTTILGARRVADTVQYGDRVTTIRVHPLGVDPKPLLERAAQPDVAAARAQIVDGLVGRRSIVRVDRTEPSKNIARGLTAYRELLRRHAEHREAVVHIALAYPSRQDVPAYRDYTTEIQRLAAAINAEFATPEWTPVQLAVRDDYPESLATLQVGDVLLVNPVRDGMNLVAKEGVVLSESSVLILSTEAGAADEMGEYALLVDPFDVDATAAAMHEALTMSDDERARRHAGLRSAATALPPREWLHDQLADLG
jgi:trehalose 6-phosphate synthase